MVTIGAFVLLRKPHYEVYKNTQAPPLSFPKDETL